VSGSPSAGAHRRSLLNPFNAEKRYIEAFASRKPKERGLAITHLLLDMAELVQVEFVGCRIGRLFDLNDE